MSPETGGTIKFPAFSSDYRPRPSADGPWRGDGLSPDQGILASSPRASLDSRWQAAQSKWNGSSYQGTRKTRQKSLSEAVRTIRTRSGSISQNALEIAEALKAPVSPMLVVLFSFWYFASVMSSTSSKVVLKTYPKPVTLTIIQFAFVSGCCFLLSYLASKFPWLRRNVSVVKNGLRYPTHDVLVTTLPITAFMIGGHILSSDAISRIDVSLVHTIKGLSPLITVAAYRFFYRERYTVATYVSLLPLTVGVILACSTNFSANFLGLLSAFASAILFVTQNIVSKKIFNAAALAEADSRITKKPDKLNLLCYSSLLALLFTAPIWLWSEGWHTILDFYSNASITLSGAHGSLDHGALFTEYVFNGIFHFFQSLTAFQLLSVVSPVTYSVASLVKRVFVIVFSIIWFGSRVTRVQALGIALTFLGLYLYDRSSGSKAGRAKPRSALPTGTYPLLPLAEKLFDSPPQPRVPSKTPHFAAHLESSFQDAHGRYSPLPSTTNLTEWLPAGTKAEDTWNTRNTAVGVT